MKLHFSIFFIQFYADNSSMITDFDSCQRKSKNGNARFLQDTNSVEVNIFFELYKKIYIKVN